jgi:hypothetical protein
MAISSHRRRDSFVDRLVGRGGHKLDRVCKRNLGKSKYGASRMLVTTNAHQPGIDSVAKRDFEAFQAQHEGRENFGYLVRLDLHQATRW